MYCRTEVPNQLAEVVLGTSMGFLKIYISDDGLGYGAYDEELQQYSVYMVNPKYPDHDLWVSEANLLAVRPLILGNEVTELFETIRQTVSCGKTFLTHPRRL